MPLILAPALCLASGDSGRGAALFDKQCAVCHSLAPEFHKEGPSMAGFWGRRAGTAPFYGGYQSLKGATFVWNDATLDAWLTDPRGMTGGKDTKMTVRVTDAGQRADLIAYLKKTGRD